ncbi:sporulation protein YunB [Desnuesiella massiliensis]|uniref:sporulation protein YunB n=1 Tax=Desnuesiella massiliensis TaxID=1650662 RepID=UPI00241C0000|nr:sporulation protein YunB [Desnuesiella massiliensis]
MRKKNYKKRFLIILVLIMILLNIFIYAFDKIIMPTVIVVSDAEMRSKAIEIINQNIMEIYSKEFNYEDFIKLEKDEEGNITLLKADTIKLNLIAAKVALKSQQDLKNLGTIGIEVPLGHMFKNNILADIGPRVKIKMQPIGHIETMYSSDFESAGINQIRHKIYIMVKTKIRVTIPLDSHDIEVKNEIPVCETIIMGKVPNTLADFNFDKIKNIIPN